jgi:hypothetical protein
VGGQVGSPGREQHPGRQAHHPASENSAELLVLSSGVALTALCLQARRRKGNGNQGMSKDV